MDSNVTNPERLLFLGNFRVRLGIEAPKDVSVCRAELLRWKLSDEREIATRANREPIAESV